MTGKRLQGYSQQEADCNMSTDGISVRTLSANAFFILLANTISSCALLAQFLMFTNLFSRVEAGTYALQIAFMAPFFLAASLQQRRILATSSPEKGYGTAAHLKTFLGAHFITVLLLFGLYTATAETSLLLVIAPMMVLRILENGADACYGFFQQQNRYAYLSISRWLHASVLIATTAYCGYVLQYSLWQILVACAATRALVACGYEFRLAWQLLRQEKLVLPEEPAAVKPGMEITSVEKNLLRLGIPLGLSGLMASIVGNTPQYVLDGIDRVELIPAFVILSRLALIGANLTRAVNESFARPMTQAFVNKKTVPLKKLLLMAFGVDLAIGLMILLTCQLAYFPVDQALQLSANGASRLDLTCVFVSMIVNNITGLSVVVMSVFRDSRRIFWLQMLSMVLVIGTCLLLIPRWGLSGSLISIALGKLPALFLGGFYIREHLREIAREEQIRKLQEPLPERMAA
ncbi:MAG: hypothetical protein KDA78_09545 [Planctomycetaceae bacterium]|nr:hypothetical protein [Planctomycetaceae bacterium]